jgi:hypothetical protein
MKTFKKVLFFALLFPSTLIFGQANWNNTSFVHRDNQVIKNGFNATITLEGVNLGGWLMWEGWMWNGGFTQQKSIFNSMEAELGNAAAVSFRDSVYGNYVQNEDLVQLSQECYNVVRIPFNHYLLEDDFNPYVYKPEGWAVLDSALSWCEQNNLFAILDLHSAPGGQSNLFTADPDLFINLWNGSINQTRTTRLWKAIADRYKNRGIIAGYDLLNEPDPPNVQDMVDLYERIIDSIRTVDTNHMLFIEGSSFATDFSGFTSLIDANMAYEFHIYTWFIQDIAAEVQQYTDLSQAQNVPVWCGEWGENNYQELDTTLKIFRNPNFGISGSAFWTWKKGRMASNYPNYMSANPSALWVKTIEWIGNNSLPKPTPTEMQTGMDEFIQSIKWANCTVNDTMSEVLRFCGLSARTEMQAGIGASAFPNPTQSDFQIELDRVYKGVEVMVRDSKGQLVKSEVFSSANRISLNLDGGAGLYFVEIKANGNRKVIKLVKN